MAFKKLNENDLLKLKLVEDISVKDLTFLVQNKDTFLNNDFNSLSIKNTEGEGEFSFIDDEGKEVKVKVPLLNISPIPFISIETKIPEIK